MRFFDSIRGAYRPTTTDVELTTDILRRLTGVSNLYPDKEANQNIYLSGLAKSLADAFFKYRMETNLNPIYTRYRAYRAQLKNEKLKMEDGLKYAEFRMNQNHFLLNTTVKTAIQRMADVITPQLLTPLNNAIKHKHGIPKRCRAYHLLEALRTFSDKSPGLTPETRSISSLSC